jgi:hypothetical protein
MNANGATDGLSIDIWNEPDLTFFWNAPQAQYLQMWGRTYHRLRLVFSGEMNSLLRTPICFLGVGQFC